MKRSNKDPSKEDGLEVIALAVVALAILFTLIWFLASHRIVYYFADPFRWMAVPYALFDPGHWRALSQAAEFYQQRPRDVGLILWIRYVNACLLPSAIVFSVACAAYALFRFLAPRGKEFKRKLHPMLAAKEIAREFPNILPVLHLGPDLVADKLPLWRRQTFPEEIWQNELIDGRPMASNGRLDVRAVETYFRGGERAGGPHQRRSGRRWSRTLGYQVVDLLADASKQQTICFADRFSAQGKVLFALLTAHAFGGREGKTDYQKACAQLSRTCAGQPNGLPNLTVAQWLYSKYRMNPMARELFAVHHWEYTYLYALFFKAKRTGKATHTDWIWLKPLDRILFYVLNTAGRATPHAEAAAAFAMFDYETKCAQNKRLPLCVAPDGSLEHHIHVLPAVEALAQEFERYTHAEGEDDDWWRKLSTWKGAEALAQQREQLVIIQREAKANEAVLAQVGPPQETPFDAAMRAQAEQQEVAQKQESIARIKEAFGSNDPTKGKSAAATGADGDVLDFL